MAKFSAQWYVSDESKETPYALTPNEGQWTGGAGEETKFNEYEHALTIARNWMVSGAYKTTRVVELNDDGIPISVRWMSVWESPVEATAAEAGTSGVPGVACKLHVWMDRELGPPDHWDWVQMFASIFKGNNNAWDLEYGREVDQNGRKILWSLKLNLYPVDKKPPEAWAWWKILGKTEEEAHEVEFVRGHEIGPREFPDGEDVVECAWCSKLHLKKLSWLGWNPETDMMENYERCFCIDVRFGLDNYRQNPDGEEFESPGCEYTRATTHAV